MPTGCHSSSTRTDAGPPGAGGAHLEGAGGIGELLGVQGPAHVAPAGGGDRDQAGGRPSRRQARGSSGGVALPSLVGQRRVAQVRPGLEVVHVRLALPEGGVVEHRAEQLAVGLEPVELERPQRQRQAADRRGRSCSVRHELGHQGVVGGAHHAAGLDGPVGPQPGPSGQRTWAAVPGVGR